MTYRYQGHFGADDPLGYRSQEEEDYYEARDCIERLTRHILDNGIASESELESLAEQSAQDVTAATAFADESPFPEPEELMTDVYVKYA